MQLLFNKPIKVFSCPPRGREYINFHLDLRLRIGSDVSWNTASSTLKGRRKKGALSVVLACITLAHERAKYCRESSLSGHLPGNTRICSYAPADLSNWIVERPAAM